MTHYGALFLLLILLVPATPARAQEATPVLIFDDEPTSSPAAEIAPEPDSTLDATAEPAPDAPTSTPAAETSPVPNTDTFTLVTDSATLDEAGRLVLKYGYAVTTDRAGTEIAATMLDATGAPAAGWAVTLTGNGTDTLLDSAHLAAGDVLPIEILVTGPVGEALQSAQLVLRSVVLLDFGDGAGMDRQPGPMATLAIQSSEPAVAVATPELRETAVSATPVARDIAPSSVEDSGRLSCQNANVTDGVEDAIGPGAIIGFPCVYAGPALITAFSATVALTSDTPAGWEISIASSSLDLLGLGVVGGQTPWDRSHTLSNVGLLGSGNVTFTVYVRAPLTSLSAGNTATVIVDAGKTCVLFTCEDHKATLQASVQATPASHSGGALLDGLLLPGLTLNAGDVLFDLRCGSDEHALVISQGEPTRIPCRLWSTLSANLLGLLRLDGAITLSTTPGPYTLEIDSPYRCADSLVSLCLADIDILSIAGGVTFDVVVTPHCTGAAGTEIQSIHLDADYGLRLAAGLVPVSLSNGSATVPFTLAEGQQVGLVATGKTLSFDPSMWQGTSYPGTPGTLELTIQPSGAGCLVPGATVTVTGMTPLTHESTGPSISDARVSLQEISDPGVSWGTPNVASGTLADTLTVFTTNPEAAPTDGSPAVVEMTFMLDPPDQALPGEYRGQITITTNPATAPGEGD